MIALIGAGPVGIEMAVALKAARLPYTHLEAGPIGATMAWWAPGTRWFSSNDRIAIAGVPLITPAQEKATREEYLAYLRAVVTQFNLDIRTYRQVVGIRQAAGGPEGRFALTLRHALFDNADEELLAANRIILATGGTATPNLLNIPGEFSPHVSHYFQDPHRYFATRLLIVGGRNSAIEAALRCHRAGARVTLVHHAPAIDAKDIKYWLYPEFSALAKSGAIQLHLNTRVTGITPASATLETQNSKCETPNSALSILHAEFDFVLLLTGYRADMSLAQMAGVSLSSDQQLPAFNPATMETSVPGVYLIGTATAGTQRRYKTFLENCHAHIPKVLAHLQGLPAPRESPPPQQAPES